MPISSLNSWIRLIIEDVIVGIVGIIAGEITVIMDVGWPLSCDAMSTAVDITIYIPPIITGGYPIDIITMGISVGILRQRPCPPFFGRGG